jgi:hypothetical protein
MPLRRALLAIAVSLLPVCAQTAPGLTALNDAFRAAYAEARGRVLAAAGPTLLVNGDTFTLIHGSKREAANVGTAIYDPVKTIAHLPLAIYVSLTPGDGAVDPARLKTLAGLRELAPGAVSALDSLKLPAATLARQKRIVAGSLAFLDTVTASGACARKDLLAFSRRMAPLLMENVGDATRAQLDATHAQVSLWRKELTPREWSDLHVVIIGPHMPREDLVVTQYFLRLLHEPAEGGRVVYAESLWQEPQAMELLGTHLLDGGIGEAFFGDYLRMHRDLLGEAAKAYLPELLKQ